MRLLEIQRRMASIVMQRLTPSDRTALKMRDGASTRALANEVIKPNDRLTSLQRVEIYNRCYWFRILDSIYDDFPGLRAVVGTRSFTRLVEAYLAECPSQSFTLRDLGSRLEQWLMANPKFAGRRFDLALDMVRLEWAHIEAFDTGANPVLEPEDLLEVGPAMRMSIQPYVRLLELSYPADELRIQVNAEENEHDVASNAPTSQKHRNILRARGIQKATVFVAVHRYDEMVYYRRLIAEEFRLLNGLRSGLTIGEAMETALDGSDLSIEAARQLVESSFAAWSQLGWFCRPDAAHSKKKRARRR